MIDTNITWSGHVFNILREAGVKQIAYVPDAGHTDLINLSIKDNDLIQVPLTTEEEGVAVLAGAWLGGQKGVLLMQSSGVGNVINMLSVADECRFPLLMIVTMRGEWGEFNPWQVPMGQATEKVLEAMKVIVLRAYTPFDVAETVQAAAKLAFGAGRKVAVLISQNYWPKGLAKVMAGRSEGTLDRREVVAHILKARGTSLLVTGLGAPTWDAAAAGDNPNNFYLWGGMGGAVSVGLGLALAQPDRRVLVLTGDGEMLMGLGSLATVGIQKPKNLAVCVIDNQRYGETGMQETATFFGVDLSAIAQGAGFLNALTIRDQDDLALAIRDIFVNPGPVFVAVKVKPTDHPMVLPEKDGLELKHRFRAQILGARKEI